MTVRATLYVKSGCRYCAAMRDDLTARGVAFVEVDLTQHPEATAELLKLTRGRRLVPVLVEGASITVAPAGGAGF